MTDTELITLLQRGDEDAFTAIFRRYSLDAYHIALRVLHDHYAAQDAVQDVFVKLWEIRNGLQPGLSIMGLISTMTWRHSRDIWQKDKWHRELAPTFDEAIYPNHVEVKEEQEMIRRLLNRLKEPYRQALVLKYIVGLRQREIGRLMGLTTQTIANRISVALHQLRKQPKPAL